MRMTIDKAVDRLEGLHFEQDNWEYGELTEDCLLNREALRLAINTLRKYQKIEQIVNNYRSSLQPYTKVIDEDIRKVLEDGDND